jgi:DNA topoisomerase-1
MQLRTGRFGKYFACTRYPDCKNARKLMRNGEAAPPKIDPVHMRELKCEKSDGYFVLRSGAAGIFLASSEYPRSRETRPPRVEDLARHKDEVDAKYRYLADAPAKDPKGNPTIVRFARKSREHYLGSIDKHGEPTGFAMFLIDGKWTEKEADAEDQKRGKRPVGGKRK